MKIASDKLTLKQVIKMDLNGMDVTAFEHNKIGIKDFDFEKALHVPMIRDKKHAEKQRIDKENEFLNKEIASFFDFTEFSKVGEKPVEEIREFVEF